MRDADAAPVLSVDLYSEAGGLEKWPEMTANWPLGEARHALFYRDATALP